MSGHSKWSTIKHQKAAADQKRGKAFSKVGKAISVAVKEGKSGDPDSNPRLRLAMEQARAVNMPNDNVKRAIERGLGKGEGASLETVYYEGFGPDQIALIVECVTDNKNRSGAEVRSFLERKGGNLGSPGSTSYMFTKKGLILVQKDAKTEEQILKLIDLGADDVEEDDNLIEVYTKPEQLEEIRQKAIQAGFTINEASLVMKPITLLPVTKQNSVKILSFLQELEDLEDVLKVYCNADFETQ